MEEEANYSQSFSEPNFKLRDLEEKQRIIKNRLLLIGQNLIETKEKITDETLEIKKDIEKLKTEVEKITRFLETISGEFAKFAKKDDIEILLKKINLLKPNN
jgi:hypothetical protein